ncbi:wax ester synthase/diacylglycerol acyltransferase 5-like [Aristolochia californica]|uniref:wax ester synthase/diacylglycerol acyltransferase 5-like n=1 Tax=Aristolochia californica TaxID=171875 RepID=UPI0035D53484
MGGKGEQEAEPVTPAGRFFLQPKGQNIIHCVVGLMHPIDIEATKREIKNTLLKHPRFCSLLIRDKHGRELWKRTQVEIDNHVIFPDLSGLEEAEPAELGSEEELINRYLADLAVSSPLDETKPLWEIHILQAQRCCVLRIHHALGDGISLMSLFLASCRRAGQPDRPPSFPLPKPSPVRSVKEKLRRMVMVVWLTILYSLEFVLYSLWVKDPETAISGGAGVELWPRKVATARFSLEDMKLVKKAVGGTVNDVLFGVVTSGLARYLEMRTPRKSSKASPISGLALVNTRLRPGLQDLSLMLKQGSKTRWGNQMGYVVLPIDVQQKDPTDPLEYLRKAKAMLDRKKLSLEARFSYKMGSLVMSLFGPKIATWINYRIISRTTFTISNVAGPQEETMFAGNPIRFLRATSTSIPHALTMHMVSYMGSAEMQILVAKDIIPDPGFLAKCFQDALLEMKDASSAALQTPQHLGIAQS